MRCLTLFFRYRLNQEKANAQIITDWYIRRQHYLSFRYHLFFYAFSIGVGYIFQVFFQVLLPLPQPFNILKNCLINIQIPSVIIGGLGGAVMLPLIMKLLRIHDAFHIKTELFVLTFAVAPLLLAWLILEFLQILVEQKYILLLVAMGIVHVVMIIIPLYLTTRKQKAPRRLTNGSIAILASINRTDLFMICMENEQLFAAFQKHCIESFCVENLHFYRDALRYRGLNNPTQRLELAKEIRELYLLPESRLYINVTGDTRKDTLESQVAPESLFEGAMSEVLEQLYQDIFPKFRNSKRFLLTWEQIGSDNLLSAKKAAEQERRMKQKTSASSSSSQQPDFVVMEELPKRTDSRPIGVNPGATSFSSSLPIVVVDKEKDIDMRHRSSSNLLGGNNSDPDGSIY